MANTSRMPAGQCHTCGCLQAKANATPRRVCNGLSNEGYAFARQAPHLPLFMAIHPCLSTFNLSLGVLVVLQ
jgi:hypothetical protein